MPHVFFPHQEHFYIYTLLFKFLILFFGIISAMISNRLSVRFFYAVWEVNSDHGTTSDRETAARLFDVKEDIIKFLYGGFHNIRGLK